MTRFRIIQRMRSRLSSLSSRLKSVTSETSSQSKSAASRTSTVLTSPKAKLLYTLVAVVAVSVVVLRLSWRYAGPINTIVYFLGFVVALTAFPMYIALLGASAPGAGAVAKLHAILGAMAFWRTVLVQFDDRYELCPATKDRVYVEGEWYDIKGGHNNWSMLGWRPFGILRFKDRETMADYRVDTKAEYLRGATADGGTVERGGVREQSPPAVTGIDGKWVIDLKRVFSRGIRKIGDIELIETAEEVTSRQHARSGITSGYETIIGTVVGLILGLMTGYFMLVP